MEAGIIRREDVPSRFRNELGTTNGQIIGKFIEDMIRNSDGKDYICISAELGDLLCDLIRYNCDNIYKSPEAEGYQTQASKGIKHLFDDLLSQIRSRDRFRNSLGPDPYENDSVPAVYRFLRDFVSKDMKDVYSSEDPDELIVLDFIAGMTDSFAIRSVSDVFIPKMTV